MASATSERGMRLAKKRQTEDRETEKIIIGTLMKTVQGRRWIWLQLSSAQIFIESGNLEPGRMAFEKGMRTLGLSLLAAVTTHAAPMYVRMMEENSGQKLTEEDEDDGGRADDSFYS